MFENPIQRTLDGGGIRVGGRVRVLSLDKKWYSAVVLVIKAGRALVHYPEWDHSYNEWVGVESRRLMYKGKVSEDVQDEAWCEDDSAVDIDIEQAISDAYGLGQEDDVEGDDENVGMASSPALKPVPSSRPRGRPTSSRNRRVAGKNRAPATKRKRKQAPKAPEPAAEAPPAENTVAEEPAPQVPRELRIAAVRVFRPNHNPYARFPHPSTSSDSDSAHEIAGDCPLQTDADDSPAKRSRVQKENAGDLDEWRSNSYVTTGAFMTRRAVKCLANDSSGGIMQDHHGYYPGELAEVLNANRKWYVGRVISYLDKKFLVHYAEWGHGHNEWIAAGSKRMRKLRESPMACLPGYAELLAETEEQARKICAALVDEYNKHVEELEQQKREKDKAKRKSKPRKAPVNARVTSLTSSNLAAETSNAPASASEEEMDDLPDVDPISVDSGYKPVPHLLRVKDYAHVYHKGMMIAARDRNRLWWKAEITDVKTFRIRVHYIGFSRRWDEWMEMNTQRIMLATEQPDTAANAEPPVPATSAENDSQAKLRLDTGPERRRRAFEGIRGVHS
ncbi:hypothetical protein DL89DRAFT_81685 [Linderina pennispora]|uniref:Uncharacterized protein n=1 Tax=Linderina pennispora TaxID=61395 RepID=A0A1Y1WGM1_9FUNG|nr:uncharacterized protein DL89DRAFT_81685 [Linderina pennispora]ORX72701.1 hypothetical protein DL89DRAFT_81685 [Linderina pennispora]